MSLPFLITQMPLLEVPAKEAMICPPGQWCYIVRALDISAAQVQEVWAASLIATQSVGHSCKGTAAPWTPDFLEFHLTHALEHFAAVDILQRHQANLTIASPPFCGAKTIHVSEGSHVGASLFWFRKGFIATPTEESLSVQNASLRVRRMLSTMKLDTSTKEPHGPTKTQQ